jgi:hypothetical protein
MSLPVAETVPFRLTRQLAGLLAPHDPREALLPGVAAALDAVCGGGGGGGGGGQEEAAARRAVAGALLASFARQPAVDWRSEAQANRRFLVGRMRRERKVERLRTGAGAAMEAEGAAAANDDTDIETWEPSQAQVARFYARLKVRLAAKRLALCDPAEATADALSTRFEGGGGGNGGAGWVAMRRAVLGLDDRDGEEEMDEEEEEEEQARVRGHQEEEAQEDEDERRRLGRWLPRPTATSRARRAARQEGKASGGGNGGLAPETVAAVLLEMAMDDRLLGRMWEGWRPWA